MADSKSSTAPHSDERLDLALAAKKGEEGQVETLLRRSDVRQLLEASTGVEKFTALHVAASAGYDSIVKKLVGAIRGLGVSQGEVEVLMNVRDCRERTPLHLAAWMQHGNVTKTLLSYNEVTVNARDVNHFTPAHLLLLGWKGDVEALKPFLGRPGIKLDEKAIRSKDTRLQNWSRDMSPMQPIEAKSESDRWDLVSNPAARKIVDDIEAMLRPIVDEIEAMLRPIVKIKNEEKLGMSSVMHIVAFLNLPEFMGMLVRRPEFLPYINAENSAQQTPLHVASLRGNLGIVQFLNEQPTLRGAMEDKSGQTAVEMAFEIGWGSIFRTLMQRQDVQDYVSMQHADRSVYVDGANAILVGAALIASITFAGWLQPPLGYQQYSAPSDAFEQYAAINEHITVKIFWISNSLSFYFAIAALLAGAGAVVPRSDLFVRAEVKRLNGALFLTGFTFAWAVVFVVMAFTAAGFAALPPITKYRMYMVVTTVVGLLICFYTFSMARGTSDPSISVKYFKYVDPAYHFSSSVPKIMKYCCRPFGYKSTKERIKQRKHDYNRDYKLGV